MNGAGYQDLHFRRGDAPPITLRTRPLPDGSFHLDLPNGSVRAEVHADGDEARFLIDGVARRLRVVRRGAELTVIIAGQNHVVVQEDPLAPPRTETAGDERVTAPIPGRVARVLVQPGDVVEKNASGRDRGDEDGVDVARAAGRKNRQGFSRRRRDGRGRSRDRHFCARGARMTPPSRVRIVEVGPRDRLQNEPNTVPPEAKVALIEAVARAGPKTIEAGSFVSAKWVSHMADTADVFARLDLESDIDYPVLVPNLQGLDRALKAGVPEVAVFGSASESFSQRNINCSIEESFDRFTPVIEKARGHGLNIAPARSRTRLEGRARSPHARKAAQ
jgi:hypothetical protein